jgi:hypothetical protein
VFISYRRSDIPHFAGRIAGALRDHFGEDRVFIDVESIDPGVNFRTVIANELANSSVVIVVLGREWATVADECGPRLFQPEDVVRMEIATALRNGIRVMPVLSDDASMPREPSLPREISEFAGCNGIRVRHEGFRDDIARVVANWAPPTG